MTIGVSNFAKSRHTPESSFSYYAGSWEKLVKLVEEYFDKHTPGFRPGVVQVEVPSDNFFSAIVPLNSESVLESTFKPRAPGEQAVIHTIVKNAKKSPAKRAILILYSAEALLENGGTRSTECDWEIVSINASPNEGGEPMNPMTMARNFLELSGGTKTEYTARQFAEAILFWNTHAMVG